MARKECRLRQKERKFKISHNQQKSCYLAITRRVNLESAWHAFDAEAVGINTCSDG